jgi:hypothetical protein
MPSCHSRVDIMKVMCQSHARHFCQCTRHLHSHRACANEYERKQLLYLRRGSLGRLECSELLSLFKCQQYLCANTVGVAQRYQAWRNSRPLVVSKIVILNAGGEDKEVVCYVVLLKANNALQRIDAGHFAQKNVDVVLAAENGPERTRNFICRKVNQ